jgi:hypothetical protein
MISLGILTNDQTQPKLSCLQDANRAVCARRVGNPSGRPKRDYDIAELARQHTEDAIRTLVEILQDTKASAGARISAANAILDRGYGKAPQSIDVGPTNDECFVQLWRMIGEGRLAKIDL